MIEGAPFLVAIILTVTLEASRLTVRTVDFELRLLRSIEPVTSGFTSGSLIWLDSVDSTGVVVGGVGVSAFF